MRILYWTKQREQGLMLGRRGLASALARELALNISIEVRCGAHFKYAFGIRIECQWLDGSVSSISEKREFTRRAKSLATSHLLSPSHLRQNWRSWIKVSLCRR